MATNKSAGFDVAAGAYQDTLNQNILPQLYEAMYPKLLRGSVPVGEINITSVDYDIQATPVVSLTPSKIAANCIAASLVESQNATEASNSLGLATAATFTAQFSKVAFTINYENGHHQTIPNAPVELHATVNVSTDSYLMLKILSGKVTVPGEPITTQVINNTLMPYLIKLFNGIIDPIKIPPLEFKSLKISTPLPVVQQSYLTAFSILGSNQPSEVPAPLSWPKNGVYFAVDIPIIEAAADILFPITQGKDFSYKIFSGHVGITVNKPSVSHINADGSLHGSIQANASCQLSMKTEPETPPHPFTATATLTVTCTLLPYVEDSVVKIKIEGVPTVNFSFHFDVPSSLEKIFKPLEKDLANALNTVLNFLLMNALNFPQGIPIYRIPEIPITFEVQETGITVKIKIVLEKATPQGMTDPDFLLVTTQPKILKQ